jgi:hypothetical protein
VIDVRHDPRAASAVEVLFAEANDRARRRRWRRTLLAIFIVALAAGTSYLVAGRSSPSPKVGATPAPQIYSQPESKLFTAAGIIIADPASHQPAEICAGIATSLPPGCGGGVPLRNLDLQRVPTVRTMGSVTFTERSIRVVGTYSDGELTLTQQPEVDTTIDPGDAGPDELPCATPATGWNSKILPGDYASKFNDYGAAHPATFGGFWVTRNQDIAVVSVTSDLARTRQELRRFYPGNLCVTKAIRPERQLLLISGGIMPAVGQPNPLRIFSTSADIIASKVDIGLVIDDASVERTLKDRYPSGIIRLHPFLTPVKRTGQ